MLKKRTRSSSSSSNHKDQQNMGHPMVSYGIVSESHFGPDGLVHQKYKSSCFFNVPGLFVGFNPKVSDSDAVRSPTSPLDFRVFSNLGSPFRSTRTKLVGNPKSWDRRKVGLSIIDSLDDETKPSGKILRASDSKNILIGPQMRIKSRTDSFGAPKSLPKNVAIFPYSRSKPSNLQKGKSDVLFEIGEPPIEGEPFGSFRSFSLDSGRSSSYLTDLSKRGLNLHPEKCSFGNGISQETLSSQFMVGSSKLGKISSEKLSPIPASVSSGSGFIGPLSVKEIELSEDYTCVKTHGPNPKVTHIFGDCILECHNNEFTCFSKKDDQGAASPPQVAECSELPPPYPSSDFLSFCYSCKKNLDGEDIYMYRGEKAFCSSDCRSQEILIDEEMEKADCDFSEGCSMKLNRSEEFLKVAT